jgi:predicted nuclease of predicted toxin-antitoxin system
MMMVKLYSNENFPMDIVRELRQLGYDVLTSYEAGQANQGIPDEEVLIFATQNQRIVITLNRDDFIALHNSGIAHNGIIICKTDRDYLGQTQTLHAYLQDIKSQSLTWAIALQNRLIRVKKQNQPKSSRQVFVIQEYL